MIDLGTLGGDRGFVIGVNNAGQVAGTQIVGGQLHAFLWEKDTGMKDLGTLDGTLSFAGGINEKGQVVGTVGAAGRNHAFYWDTTAGMIDIAVANGRRSHATGINNRGQVVGHIFSTRTNSFNAFIWKRESGLKELGLSSADVRAQKINDSGQIIGFLRTKKRFLFFSPKEYCFLRTTSGRIVNLDRFRPYQFDALGAIDINNRGWIVGLVVNIRNNNSRPILLRPVK